MVTSEEGRGGEAGAGGAKLVAGVKMDPFIAVLHQAHVPVICIYEIGQL